MLSIARGQHLYHSTQVPAHFRESFILTGYRCPRSSFGQCVRSMFQSNNETLNVWTHLLPSLYFMWRFYQMWDEGLDFVNDPYVQPMFIYMMSVCLFPLASTLAHVFNTMSSKARHVCFFVDYAALSLYSYGAAVAYRAYSFPEALAQSWFGPLYLHIAIINALVSMVMACSTRYMRDGRWKKAFRMFSFAVPYVFDTIPIMYRLAFCQNDHCYSGGMIPHLRQYLLAFLSAALYSSHIPERFSPGKFDIIGHSHQLFHVTTAIGSHDQVIGFLLDQKEHRPEHLDSSSFTNDIPSFDASIRTMAAIGTIDIIVLVLFSLQLWRIVPGEADPGMYHRAPRHAKNTKVTHERSINNNEEIVNWNSAEPNINEANQWSSYSLKSWVYPSGKVTSKST